MVQEHSYKNARTVQKEIDLRTIFRDLLKRWWVILSLSIAVTLMANIVLVQRFQPLYTTEMTYVVTSRGMNNSVYTNLRVAQLMAERFSEIITSPVLQEKIGEDLGTGKVEGTITCEVLPETNLLVLKVSVHSPQMAYLILKSIMKNYPTISEYLIDNAVMQILTQPKIPTTPINESAPLINTIKVFLLALFALTAGFAALSFMKDTVRSASDVDRKLDCANLGSLCHESKRRGIKAKIRRAKDSVLISRSTTSFRYVEMLQKISRKVQNKMRQENAKTLLITSCLENEGKSTVAANLALAMAEGGKKVLLMDLDLRKPSQHLIFDLGREKERSALGSVLMGRKPKDDLIEVLSEDGAYAIFNTREYAQSTEMLSSGRLEVLLDYLKTQFDYILIDTPPMKVSSDAEAVASAVDTSLVVVKEHLASVRDINDSLAVLLDAKAKPIGCVLNNAHSILGTNVGGYGYGQTYGYGYGKSYGKYGKNAAKSRTKSRTSNKEK